MTALEFLATAVSIGIFASAITWHYMPVLRIKEWIGMSEEDYTNYEGGKSRVWELTAKLLNCPTCVGWWCGLLGLPLLRLDTLLRVHSFASLGKTALLAIACGIIASLVSEVIYRIANRGN
jgi:hypothetical protein